MMAEQKNTYRVIGLMSGTSLDGLDLCYCELEVLQGKWSYQILQASTIAYEPLWQQSLQDAPQLDGEQLTALHTAFGKYCGKQVNQFILDNNITPDLISSHGHTVFHRPELGYTLQIGCGATIAATTGITTVCDFRSPDVALGGQGAPLVPIGDRLLFSDFDFCLNIGGFSNISFEKDGQRIAFDISPANIVLNALAAREGLAFDPDGKMAARGIMISGLYEKLNALPYYETKPPKSLGREWVTLQIEPLIKEFQHHATADLLCTLTEHIAFQISRMLPNSPHLKLLASGGGALNQFMIQRIRQQSQVEIIVADQKILHYKEALIFALLGVLRLRNENNCLSSVTGAARDHCSGCVYLGK